MPLNKQTGNMYDFVTHTWNPIKGRCSHDCSYCYMDRFWKMMPDDTLRLDEKELKTKLGKDKFIFVGSSTDMWANDIPDDWILSVLEQCSNSDNKYLLQSKNPARFLKFIKYLPKQTILGTTIETNRNYFSSKAPTAKYRAYALNNLFGYTFQRMITIEPILDFDLNAFIALIKLAKPYWVNIGADSGRHNLPEPSYAKVKKLITELSKFTEVRKKRNLERLMK